MRNCGSICRKIKYLIVTFILLRFISPVNSLLQFFLYFPVKAAVRLPDLVKNPRSSTVPGHCGIKLALPSVIRSMRPVSLFSR